ncbi:hypothetical protein [Archangium lipolyticum]|uniref:hypothetical protein n=1 Tax=Archangium lipolyticum TaxID=2970465 RepID=UPI00214A368F|nr:hypothetical protein [Archangium lipolyticum]
MAIAMTALVLLLVSGTDAAAAEPPLTYLSAAETGKTIRRWDCCKPSGSWPGKADVKTSPVNACAKDGKTVLSDRNALNACQGGSSYICSNNQPWAVDANMSYGFAAAALMGKKESDWLCGCYALQFTSGFVKGKTHVVQVIDTAVSDGKSNVFDLLIPGGGVGLFNGCTSQFNAPGDGWGARYGGVSSKAECARLPADLRAGCNWRFDWFSNADNPTVSFRRVKCPTAITARTGCIRKVE